MTTQDCRLCDNFIKRKNAGTGYGNINSDVMFLFDHPRYRQDKLGTFTGDKNMEQFMSYLHRIGYNELNAYFTFVVKCKPTNEYSYVANRNICANEHLSKEFKGSNGNKKLIIAVGAPVALFIFNDNSFKYFKPYKVGSAIIAIPNPVYFIKGGDIAREKLKVIKDTHSILK